MTATAVPAAPAVPGARAVPRGALLVLSLAAFMSSLDLFIVNLAFPALAREFGGSGLSALSWVLNAYTIVFAAALVPAGRYGDRLGRRRVFTTGLVVFSAGSAACALSPGVAALVGARMVQALGAGLMVPTSLSLLLEVVPPAGRARAIGTWSAIGAMGAAFGPVAGGLLVQVGWRSVFWVNIPFGLAAVLLGHRALPASRPEARQGRRPDALGALMLAAGVGLLALALVRGPSWGWRSVHVVGLLLAAVVLVVLVGVQCARHPAPLLELPMLRTRSFAGACAASVAYYAGFGAFLLNNVEFLTGPWHYTSVRAGLAIAPGPLTVLPFARLVGPRLIARVGAARVAAAGCLLAAAVQLGWWACMTATPSYAAHLLPWQVANGAAVGLVIPSLVGAGTAGLSPARFGSGSGVLTMGRQLGGVLGVAALVAVLGSTEPDIAALRHGVLLVVGCFALAALLSLCAGPARPPRTGTA